MACAPTVWMLLSWVTLRIMAYLSANFASMGNNDGNSGDVYHNDNEPRGSNGMAVSPKNTTAGRALLLINPHTSFFFREELQMTSDEGLNAYGASTWGQFFIYQGFNATAGWMHTTSAADRSDEFLETVSEKGGKYVYKYGNDERPLVAKTITVRYKNGASMAERKFTVYYTHFGPIVRAAGGKWVAIRIMQEPLKALTQSYTRTKSKNLAEFRKTMELKTNSSNNTLFADAEGNIAYLHANFIPRRNPALDWRNPVDGSTPESEWTGLLDSDEEPNAINPASGWVYNSNDWPWANSGPSSPLRVNFPAYVDNGTESHRGRHAVMVLQNRTDFSITALRWIADKLSTSGSIYRFSTIRIESSYLCWTTSICMFVTSIVVWLRLRTEMSTGWK